MSKHDAGKHEHRLAKEQWIEARRALLAEEKAWTHERDRLSKKRRALPWVKVEKNYVFEGVERPGGARRPVRRTQPARRLSLHVRSANGRRVAPAVRCSRIRSTARGSISSTTMSASSRSRAGRSKSSRPIASGWAGRSAGCRRPSSDFNFDYHVSFPEGAREGGVFYNFEQQPDPEIDELPGVSVFYKDDGGTIYHTYSTYGRGGEMFLPVYGWLDVVPKGRNETKNGNLMDWVRRHDRYEDDGRTQPAIPATAKAS